jgi:phospholipid-transporting ATPase
MAELRTLYSCSRDLNAGFESNYISTTKYNLITFLPLSLFLQFRKVANVYFLITAVLQSVPQISPLNPFSAIAPLVFVLIVSMVREGVEDYMRWKADREFNSTPTSIYIAGKWCDMTFKDVQVGDLVKVTKDSFFPCDLIVLASSEPNGVAKIETSSLDGEKNLKTRQVVKESSKYFEQSNIQFWAELTTQPPNAKINEFEGSIKIADSGPITLGPKQVLLCGASLRNTEWAIGVTIYTGRETKLRQNLSGRRFKQSQIERTVNKNIIAILILQAVLCLIAAIMGGVWVENSYDDHWYLGDSEFSPAASGVLLYCTYFLLLNTMIPISLIISLEIVKLAQAFYMVNDQQIYSKLRNRTCKVSDSTLNEELGQIQHIFTDKTGTLTCNRMEFKNCTIGNEMFGEKLGLMDGNYIRKPTHTDAVLHYAFDDAEMKKWLRSDEQIEGIKVTPQFTMRSKGVLVKMFLQAMALTHELLVEYDKDGRAKYSGNSPDEITLVDAARRIGVKYLGVAEHDIHCIAFDDDAVPEMTLLKQKQHGKVFEFQRRVVLEFNSNRKRNSVIVEDKTNKQLMLFTKGADNMVMSRLSPDNNPHYVQKVKDDIDFYANAGYRTLVYAFKLIDPQEFEVWNREYELAVNSVGDREKIVGLVAEKIEGNLILLGCTAVEDKLQEDVPSTIHDLRQADIKIWMLTGDKLGTAINIGRSCRLLEDNMKVIQCKELPIRECLDEFKKIAKQIQDVGDQQKIGLCIEGASIDFIFYDADDPEKRQQYPEITNDPSLIKMTEVMREIFISFAKVCHSVIVCRATPKQKQETVRLMKQEFGTITLSIGDGANDVPMIMEAHIGVGLYGEEGMQAVQASDYAIGEFRFLWELVLAHGHWHYIRQSEMILYFFYKNFLFTFCQFLYCFFCASSGRTVHDDWYISCYNLIFTALPLLIRALYETDRDLPKRNGSQADMKKRREFAEAYLIGQKGLIFTKQALAWWVFKGFIHAIMVFFITYAAHTSGILTTDGRNTDLWSFSIIEFTCIIFIVNLELALNTRSWNWMLLVSIWLFSIGIYIAFTFVYDLFQLTSAYSSIGEIASSPYLYLCVILTVSLSLVTTGAARIFDQIKQGDPDIFKVRPSDELQGQFEPVMKSESLGEWRG